MTTRSDRLVPGAALLASALLSAAMYAVLATAFSWPAILDEPAAVVLPAFSAAETTIRTGFWLMAVSSLLLIPAAVYLGRLLDTSPARSAAVATLTTLGVLGPLVQCLGWLRWPVAVPYLADAWASAGSDGERFSVATTFDTLNLYGGGALGEHLGWFLQAFWAVGVAVLVLPRSRWFGGTGLLLAGVWAVLVVAAVPLRYTETGLEAFGLTVYSVWYVWLGALGVWLLVDRSGTWRPATSSAAAAPAVVR